MASIERKRVYLSPLKHLLGIILPKSVISSIQARRHKGNTSTVENDKQPIAGDTLLQEFSLTDFDIGEYKLPDAYVSVIARSTVASSSGVNPPSISRNKPTRLITLERRTSAAVSSSRGIGKSKGLIW